MTPDQKTLSHSHQRDLKHYQIQKSQAEPDPTSGMTLMRSRLNTQVLGITQEDNSVVQMLVGDTLNLATVHD